MTAASDGRALRVAVIGAGGIAQRHLDAIEAHPEALELVAVCDPSAAAVERTRTRFPRAAAFATVDELLDSGGFEAAVIATPHVFHFDQAVAVVRAGIDVLVEKPVVTTTGQMRALREVADASGAIVVPGQTRRYAPEVIAARAKTLDPQVFGELQGFDIVSVQDIRSFGRSTVGGVEKLHWLFDGAVAGGGVTISLAIHQIDMLRFLTGLDYAAVMAVGRFDAPFFNGAESQVAAALEMSNGATGTLHADYLATRIPFAEAMTLIGERGSVTQHATRLGQYRGPLSFATSNGQPSATFDESFAGWAQLEGTEKVDEVQVPFTNQLLSFAEAVRNRRPDTSLVDNFNTIAAVEAIVLSARKGQKVQVEKW